MPRIVRPARARALAIGVAMVVALGVVAAVPRPAIAEGPVDYKPPVDAEVVDGFHIDGGPYSRGNRGLEYGTVPGTVVRAAADGRVVFRGTVASSRHVTVLHDDGIRTSYSFLDEISVANGQRVRQGDRIGTTKGRLHFGARRGDAYFDPATLFKDGPPRVYLVPFDRPPGLGSDGERSALRQLAGGMLRAGAFVVDKGGVLGAAVADGLSDLAGEAGQIGRIAVHLATTWAGRGGAVAFVRAAVRGIQAWMRECTQRDVEVPRLRDRHVAVLVAGLGSSSSDGAGIDDLRTAELGYDPADVVRYSYSGGRVEQADRGASFAGLPTSTYASEDTEGDIRAEGRSLARFIEEVAAEQPGVPIDLYAHSLGGLVARTAIQELVERHGAAWVADHLNLFMTFGTPHQGADLATAAYTSNSTTVGNFTLEVLERLTDLDADAPAAQQLTETSDLVRSLAETPIPEGLPARSIAAASDIVVPVPRTKAEGMESVVVPTVDPRAHGQLPGSAAATREVALALDGRPPTCQTLATHVVSEVVGEGISAIEDTAGAAAWAWQLKTAG